MNRPEERRVDPDHHREGVLVRDRRRRSARRRRRARPRSCISRRCRRKSGTESARRRRGVTDDAIACTNDFGRQCSSMPDDQEQEQVVVQIEQDADAVRRHFARQIAEAEQADDDRQQRAVLEPLARCRGACRSPGWPARTPHPCRPSTACPATPRGASSTTRPSTRAMSAPQSRQLCHRPIVWLSGIDAARCSSIRSGSDAGRRHDQRRGRRQPERPHAADAQIRGRPDGAIVGAAHAVSAPRGRAGR